MSKESVRIERFLLETEGLRLPVKIFRPAAAARRLASVQIHHAGGGYEPIYDRMATDLAGRGMVGITMIHRGYPEAGGSMEYGKGEIADIGNLVRALDSRPCIDPERMGIMGYSRGAHNALLAVERLRCFRAAALWSVPVDMIDHVSVNPWIAEIIGGSAQELPEEYRSRSGLLFADRIDCPVLLLHGQEDEVVPVRHALRLAEALGSARKPCELRVVAGEGHVWSPAAFGHNWRITAEFFERTLKIPGAGGDSSD